ncbi:FmdB family zinc ribbon protein [Spartinivicinus poritis]|uniref:Zinc ribbon domain-containing protein n=1 Tax=Spartinivicinus poritis TaxID=2994640 RepID=A0ABT5U841_9GAMM|nr:zinc ribbon domain-containing protein [Spartinivicinus sp. A2-2]MDE1462360.1 zinc ribbon domain-containing protein [Spartinivicinus sp. A2-2]
MPIYEYLCGQCEHTHEVIQKISDDPLTTCPQCGVDALKKLLSAPAFRLKGSGWYETDFKTGAKKNLVDSGESKSKPATEKKATSTPAATGSN